jgi:NhaC family Na+:H+ antiporter
MAATLGVATLDYLPYALFNLINPVLAGILAYTGFKILKIELGGKLATRHDD